VALTIEDLVELAKVGLGQTDWTDIFAAGRHRDGDRVWTHSDLDAIVRNFRLGRQSHDPPVGLIEAGLGHDEEQARLEDSGLPAAGRVIALRRRGDRLQAKFGQVPALVADAINYGLYSRCSAELYDEPPPGLPGHGPMLRRVAFLGFDVPAVKRLKPIPRVQYTEALARLRRPPRHVSGASTARHGGRLFVHCEYQEGPAVDDQARQALVAVIKGKWPDLSDEFLNSLDDDQLTLLAQAAAPGGAAVPTEAPAEMQEPPAATAGRPPRPEQEQAIIAAGLATAEELATMTDDEVWELYQQATGTAAAPAPATMGERPAGARPPFLPARPVPMTARQFAELSAAARRIEAQQRLILASQAQARKEAARAAQAGRRQAVRLFCEQMTREGRMTPADADEQEKVPAVRRVPNEFYRLLYASGVKKFGETALSEFEAAMAAIRARPAGYARLFAEKIPGQLDGGQDGGELTPQRRAELLANGPVGRAILKTEKALKRQS
jgi:hypothetical protein